jgi:hypothetical protein
MLDNDLETINELLTFLLQTHFSTSYFVCGVTLSVHPHRASWKVCLTTLRVTPQTSYSPEYITPTHIFLISFEGYKRCGEKYFIIFEIKLYSGRSHVLAF